MSSIVASRDMSVIDIARGDRGGLLGEDREASSAGLLWEVGRREACAG